METPNDPKFNPYRVPVANAEVSDAASDDGGYIPGGRAVAADEGLKWISSAWQLFVAAPLMWIVMVVLYAISFMVLAFVPFIGTLAGYFLYVIFGAGWLVGARAVAKGEPLLLDHLFAGFKNKTAPLLVLGAVYAAGSLAILLLMLLFVAIGLGVSGIMAAVSSGDISLIASIIGGSIITFLMALLIGAALLVPLLMALWFAPALVYFHNETPIDALKISFMACLKNWLPFLLYGVVMLIVFVIASIPFMLGFLVAGPLAIISGYTSYRAVFIDAA